MKLEVLFTPAEFAALDQRDLSATVCVVFDVLRATSTMITALAHGAAAILPVAEIPEALALRARDPDLLLAGERDGVRIRSERTGGIDFDLGNSPREFTPERVSRKSIIMTTTNGTRALRACAAAQMAVVGSFLNMAATAELVRKVNPDDLLVICSGTFEQAAYEDVLGAGAFCDLLWAAFAGGAIADSAKMARRLFRLEQADLPRALAQSRNGARLLSRPELADDVRFCLQRNVFDLVATLCEDGAVRRRS